MAVINWTEFGPPERKRTYHFPGGEVLTFEGVTRIEIRDSGKHRVECAPGKDGKVRRAFVSPGWLWVELDIDDWTC